MGAGGFVWWVSPFFFLPWGFKPAVSIRSVKPAHETGMGTRRSPWDLDLVSQSINQWLSLSVP